MSYFWKPTQNIFAWVISKNPRKVSVAYHSFTLPIDQTNKEIENHTTLWEKWRTENKRRMKNSCLSASCCRQLPSYVAAFRRRGAFCVLLGRCVFLSSCALLSKFFFTFSILNAYILCDFALIFLILLNC